MAGCLVLFILLLISVWLADIFGDTVGGSFFWGIIIISAVLGKIFSKTDADNHQIKAVKNKEENSTQVSVIQSEETPMLFQENQPIPKQPVNKEHRLPKSSQKRSTKEWRESNTKTRNLNTISFSYSDVDDNFSYRTIDIHLVDSKYIEGYCHDRKAERTFRIDRILGGVTLKSNDEYLSLDDWLKEKGIYSRYRETFANNKPEQLEICFTGFLKNQREYLETLATIHDFLVRKTVTINLTYLVCGKNAGWSKKQQAESNGASCMNESEFLTMIDTGEIPDPETKQAIDGDNPLSGKTLCFVGRFKSFTLSEGKVLAEKHNAIVSNQVARNTDYLICGERAGAKLIQAQNLDIPILVEDDFLALVRT
ncbi:BRCT domain-containing protein [Testudinibacter aquarius]|uniref:BRCA1 C Terminus (BRCT) protein n=1 Tax=Testudinibacter aquarius TaxID=1524974 RepID=A0A4R3YA66_9PAST|nr:BRCT domain-containing protein [Testudinibacter aquarius]KAE9526050.1 hypothetical protein A1D24_03190 [Testudinibacter aquarius]TCV87243.1 BRCA1 C Terminus (BRCT) protein [Testudinibacter aquarius]TNG91285.1 hypothetical protein FHQ21_08270 [Testudinibacter aquarius]